MNSSVLSRLVCQGIGPDDPRFLHKAKEMEAEQNAVRHLRLKENAVRGAVCKLRLDQPGDIDRWLRADGRAIRVGRVVELEVWERGTELFLAAKNQHWGAYRVTFDGCYTIRHRVA
jgi:hypothetical protein